MTEFTFPSHGKGEIHCIRWQPEGRIRAVVQIVHGIAEHAARYDRFARFLNRQNMLVVAEDHMGHGGSLTPDGPVGYFTHGWNAAVDDVYRLLDITRKENPGVPYVILGHSMGSFLTRTLLYRYPNCGLRGAILSGTAWQPFTLLKAGLAMCRSVCCANGETLPSPSLRNLIFGSYNKQVPNPSTPFDWICSDPAVVEAYIQDPLCGFAESAGLDRDMLWGMQMNQKKENLAKMPNLPVLFIAGAQDPVGNYGKGVRKSAEAFRRAGLADVSVILYANSRHEVLNDREKDLVYQDVLQWLQKKA